MNGLCGSQSTLASSAQFQDRPSTGSPIRGRAGICSSSGIGSQASTGTDVTSGGSGIPGAVGGGSVRKSRSQGGKKLQKCLSTASYGEESSLSRPQMTPLSHHNLLMTRQYCSFGTNKIFRRNSVFFFLTLN